MMSITNVCSNIVVTPGGIVVKRGRTHARRCDSSLHAPVRLRSTASTHLASGIPMRRTRKPERRGGSNGIRPCAPRAAASVPVPAAGGEQTWIPLPRATLDLPAGEWTEVPTAGVTFAKGFRAAGVYAGMRSKGTRPDLSLIVCDGPAVVGATFTLNKVVAAPVTYSKGVYKARETIRGVLINSGQANAATGETGWCDAIRTAGAAAEELGISPDNLMLASTGVIGKRIKMEELLGAIPNAVSSLARGEKAAELTALGITTTDLAYKSTAMTLQLGGREVRLGGCVKGSGMIHPNMATMLGVVTCDAAVEPLLWRQMVTEASTQSFNQITVDGDTSTNDCVVALASGLAGNETVQDPDSKEAVLLQAALTALLQGLAKTIAWDGEGATVCIECEVTGAATKEDAMAMSKSVVGSLLVKAAVHGHDPNWGRIAAAVGYAQVTEEWDSNALCIHLGSTQLMKNGQPLPYDAAVASDYMAGEAEVHGTVRIEVKVGHGEGQATAWGCDLSHAYVDINTKYC